LRKLEPRIKLSEMKRLKRIRINPKRKLVNLLESWTTKENLPKKKRRRR